MTSSLPNVPSAVLGTYVCFSMLYPPNALVCLMTDHAFPKKHHFLTQRWSIMFLMDKRGVAGGGEAWVSVFGA